MEDSNMQEVSPAPKELKGIEGWLAWFVYAALGIGGVLFNIGYFLKYAASDQILAAVICIPFIAVAIRALLLMRAEKPEGVKWAKIYLFATAVLGALELLLVPADPSGWRILLFGVGWLAYLFTSKRVRNTYFPQTKSDGGQ